MQNILDKHQVQEHISFYLFFISTLLFFFGELFFIIYLNVPKASSTTSRVSSPSKLIKLPTTPFDNNNFKLASLPMIKLETQAAAQPLSVASGEVNYT